MVHLLTPSAFNNKIKIGRGHDQDLRVNDISVSRCHSIIHLKKDGFYLTDTNSKFGTLILVRKKTNLDARVFTSV
jgi:pSer/pThr/pTyr-binding forkhead associated (FHA) protein